jgi:hypothetical protein
MKMEKVLVNAANITHVKDLSAATHWVRNQVSPKTGLNDLQKRQIFYPCQE